MPEPDPQAIVTLRAEIKRNRSPLYRGLWPLLDALDEAMCLLSCRIYHLERLAAEQAEQLAGVAPPCERVPLGTRLDADAERAYRGDGYGGTT